MNDASSLLYESLEIFTRTLVRAVVNRLDEITTEDLHQALDAAEREKPTQRLLAAIASKNGFSKTGLAAWHGMRRRTVYTWLTRLENDPLERAVRDDHRSGRPRTLTAAQREQIDHTLRQQPTDTGYDAPADARTPTPVSSGDVRRRVLAFELSAVDERS